MEANRRLLARRTSYLLAFAALLALPAVALANPVPLPTRDLWVTPDKWPLLLLMEVLIVFAEAYAYAAWAGLTHKRALVTSVLGNTASVVAGLLVASQVWKSSYNYGPNLPLLDYAVAILLVEVPLVWLMNSGARKPCQLAGVAFIVNTLTYLFLVSAVKREPVLRLLEALRIL